MKLYILLGLNNIIVQRIYIICINIIIRDSFADPLQPHVHSPVRPIPKILKI